MSKQRKNREAVAQPALLLFCSHYDQTYFFTMKLVEIAMSYRRVNETTVLIHISTRSGVFVERFFSQLSTEISYVVGTNLDCLCKVIQTNTQNAFNGQYQNLS